MPASRFATSTAALLIGAAALGWSGAADAKAKVIYSFPGPLPPFGSVNATDAAGNLYGITQQGGSLGNCSVGGGGCGTVFELMPPVSPGAAWTEQTLYTFTNGASGYYPGGLTRDAAGNLYGVSSGGLVGGEAGGGVIWELNPPAVAGQSWSLKVLYTFSPPPAGSSGGPSGNDPCGTLVVDHAGTLYGTTFTGGALHGGTVFSLAPPPPGGLAWTETVLHDFPLGKRGRYFDPTCPLTLSAGGRVLYGATRFGPEGGDVFWLRRQASGWVYQRIGLPPNGTDAPTDLNGGLVIDGNGNLFGTSSEGGAYRWGTVFELSPPSAGRTAWTEHTLHSFDVSDGSTPEEGLAVARGVTALFGTTSGGGHKSGGVIFRLDPPASGSGPWTYEVLQKFLGGISDPYGPLIFGHTHKLFGATASGGANRGGTVFSQTPDFPQTAQ